MLGMTLSGPSSLISRRLFFYFLGTAASGKLLSSLSVFFPVLFPLKTSCVCLFHRPWELLFRPSMGRRLKAHSLF